MASSTEDISIFPPHNILMTARVGRTAIFLQLPNSKGYPEAAVPRRHPRGQGLMAGRSSVRRRTASMPVLLPTSRSPTSFVLPRSPLRAPHVADSGFQSCLKPSLLPQDFLASSGRPSGSSRAVIKHPDDLTTSTNNSDCRFVGS